MCGIFGLVVPPGKDPGEARARALVRDLFLLSESRGKEAAGMALATSSSIHVYKDGVAASEMIESADFRRCFGEAYAGIAAAHGVRSAFAAIGHSRLVTNGLQGIPENNQPVVRGGTVVVHNGIVVNDRDIWQKNPGLRQLAQVDTEVIAALLDREIAGGTGMLDAARSVYADINGETSIAVVDARLDEMLLATNTGSIYTIASDRGEVFAFVSEYYIAEQFGERLRAAGLGSVKISQLRSGQALRLNLRDLSVERGDLHAVKSGSGGRGEAGATPRKIVDWSQRFSRLRENLRRCTACLLPETMPFIEFDSKGICNFCRTHRHHQPTGRDALEKALAPLRSKDGSPDCLVAFSGGRDSSYALHVLKQELGMTPIAYTYDWGMVTDLARRNQARLCGKLGIEHIWVSADIKTKRRNIRKNVEAWMRKPDLGMVPLFMAGDKQFFYFGHKIMQQTGIKLMVFASNQYERTEFKAGFCGVAPMNLARPNRLDLSRKVRLALYYLRQYLRNPAYINSSIFDTLHAFFSYYVIDNESHFVHIFDYLDWNEEVVDRTLREAYDWEIANDTPSTWRIGDGTAPVYNFIYRELAGFSEQETFRSLQIREGVLSRERAEGLVRTEAHHRYESIRDYCTLIGTDFDELVRTVQRAPKLYAK